MNSSTSGGKDGWARYLAGHHAHHAGITERLMSRAEQSPYAWLAAALRGVDPSGLIVDVGCGCGCGSAPTEPLVRSVAGQRVRWVGIDLSLPELGLAATGGRGPLVCARAGALPVADRSVDIVCAAMSLQVLTPLNRVIAEISRILRPGGSLIALIPANGGGPPAVLAWGRVFAALRIRAVPWPNPDLIAARARQLAARELRIVADDRHTFCLNLTRPDEVALAIDGLYLPNHTDADLTAARRRLRRLAPRGLRLPLPLRRIIARRQP